MIRFGARVATVFVILVWTSLAFAAPAAPGRAADGYPSKPVRILIGVSPGGGLDTTTRLVAQKLSERLGQSVVVDNRPGGTSTIAMTLAANANPDGYTLMSATKTMILNGALKRVPFDILSAYAPIAAMTTQMYVMVVYPALPVKSIGDLLAYAKDHPGKLSYGSAGIGSLQHVGMELFKSLTGANLVHVPYKGGGAAMIDLLSGQIQVMPSVTISVMPHLKAGKLRAIAVTGSHRVEVLPDVPTVAESGVPGFELTNMYGLYAPAGTPAPLVATLNREVSRIMALPDLTSTLAADGAQPAAPGSAGQFAGVVAAELDRWTKVVKDSDIHTAGIR